MRVPGLPAPHLDWKPIQFLNQSSKSTQTGTQIPTICHLSFYPSCPNARAGGLSVPIRSWMTNTHLWAESSPWPVAEGQWAENGFCVFKKLFKKKKNLKSSVYNRDRVAGLKYLLPSGPCETQLAVSQHFIQGVESHECQPAHNMASVSNELVFLLVSVEDSNNSRYIRS